MGTGDYARRKGRDFSFHGFGFEVSSVLDLTGDGCTAGHLVVRPSSLDDLVEIGHLYSTIGNARVTSDVVHDHTSDPLLIAARTSRCCWFLEHGLDCGILPAKVRIFRHSRVRAGDKMLIPEVVVHSRCRVVLEGQDELAVFADDSIKVGLAILDRMAKVLPGKSIMSGVFGISYTRVRTIRPRRHDAVVELTM